jgi:hypothetical protein
MLKQEGKLLEMAFTSLKRSSNEVFSVVTFHDSRSPPNVKEALEGGRNSTTST